ncbi:hypothetical protein ACFFX0_25835 [Citricoccus parietis]|uniref:Uncharacterized protein n=1 Tax=Citricoccus parietis TaxID=592307 RepID=A0ABV5G695_9MICC
MSGLGRRHLARIHGQGVGLADAVDPLGRFGSHERCPVLRFHVDHFPIWALHRIPIHVLHRFIQTDPRAFAEKLRSHKIIVAEGGLHAEPVVRLDQRRALPIFPFHFHTNDHAFNVPFFCHHDRPPVVRHRQPDADVVPSVRQ